MQNDPNDSIIATMLAFRKEVQGQDRMWNHLILSCLLIFMKYQSFLIFYRVSVKPDFEDVSF